MPLAVLSILAAGDDSTVKIVIGVAVAIFWLIAQGVSALSKKPDKILRPDLPPTPRPEPVPGRHPDLPGPRRGTATRTPPPRIVIQKKAPKSLPKKSQRPPVVAMRQVPPALPRQSITRPPAAAPIPARAAEESTIPETRTTAGRSTAGRTANQPGAAKPAVPGNRPLARKPFIEALLKPRNLRRAYIVAELLNPPLALRDSTHHL